MLYEVITRRKVRLYPAGRLAGQGTLQAAQDRVLRPQGCAAQDPGFQRLPPVPGQVLARPRHVHGKSPDRQEHPAAADELVITSYSIHYTKLYEPVLMPVKAATQKIHRSTSRVPIRAR